jgi:hypothetical protein
LLPSGKVLVVQHCSAELYDPESETWSQAGSMSTDHERATATLLPSGKVLIAGGVGGETTAELFNP